MRDVHTVPVNDLVDHDLERRCWCSPDISRVCPECGDVDPAGCFLCGGEGMIQASADELEDLIIAHHAIADHGWKNLVSNSAGP